MHAIVGSKQVGRSYISCRFLSAIGCSMTLLVEDVSHDASIRLSNQFVGPSSGCNASFDDLSANLCSMNKITAEILVR